MVSPHDGRLDGVVDEIEQRTAQLRRIDLEHDIGHVREPPVTIGEHPGGVEEVRQEGPQVEPLQLQEVRFERPTQEQEPFDERSHVVELVDDDGHRLAHLDACRRPPDGPAPRGAPVPR